LNLTGTAHQSGTAMRLTDWEYGQSGFGWNSTPQNVISGFDTTFTFRITEPYYGGADGFTFAVQNMDGNFVSNAGGGGLGYTDSLANSVVVEFDTYSNYGLEPLTHLQWYPDYNGGYYLYDAKAEYESEGYVWDEAWDWDSDNHVAIQSMGTGLNNVDYHQSGLGYGFPNFELRDGQAHTARVLYDAHAHTMSVFLDGSATPTATASIDLATKLSLTNGTAYVGFTGATGGAIEAHDILSWSYKSLAYEWSGFLSPIPNHGPFNAGSTVPVKFQLVGGSAGITNLTGNLTVNGSTVGTFRYDPEAGQYIANWRTTGFAPGTYTIGVDLGDYVVRQTTITLK
jgi:hypothetical protein